jgi:hypothetical protein
VRAELIPHQEWEALFRAHGIRNPIPRVRMLDGFNEGWIDFPANEATGEGQYERGGGYCRTRASGPFSIGL